jgi:hypothetical protein
MKIICHCIVNQLFFKTEKIIRREKIKREIKSEIIRNKVDF